jgi:Rrf2 family protein
MTNILNVSEAVALGIHAMCLIASKTDTILTSLDMASRLKASRAHLSKVMRQLVKEGLVRSYSGPTGGFTLQKRNAQISLLDIYEAIEGKFIPSDCLVGRPICSGKKCVFGGLLKNVNKEIKEYLDKTTLSKLVDVFGEKRKWEKESKH